MASNDTYSYTAKGTRLTDKRGNFKPSDVVASAVVQRIRVRVSNDEGLSSARITNPRASGFGKGRRTTGLGMGTAGQTDV